MTTMEIRKKGSSVEIRTSRGWKETSDKNVISEINRMHDIDMIGMPW